MGNFRFSLLIVYLIIIGCKDENPKPLLNYLRVYSENKIKEEYVYTDAYELQKEIHYSENGKIVGSINYSYDKSLITKAVVSYFNNTDSIVKVVLFSHQTSGMLYPDMTNKIIIKIEHQYGLDRPMYNDYPYELAYGFSSPGLRIFTAEYSINQANNWSVIKTHLPEVIFEFDSDGNVSIVRESYVIQRDHKVYNQYEKTANIFHKFGVIKFHSKWLSKYNRTKVENVTWFDDFVSPSISVITYEYQNFNENGFPQLVKETNGNSTKEFIYQFTKE